MLYVVAFPEVSGGRWWIQVTDNNRKAGSQSRRTGLLRPAVTRVWANPEFREQLIEHVGRITAVLESLNLSPLANPYPW